MPDSIALTRIHTPEDYWLRMWQAEEVLRQHDWMGVDPIKMKVCLRKAQQISDRYHEHWTTTRKEYLG